MFGATIQGLLLGGSMIIPIGAQNAHILNQGSQRNHHIMTATICILCDVLLIGAGVFGAISQNEQPLSGCECTKLGEMNYVLVATPEFAATYLPNGLDRQALLQAPAVSFDHKDDMHIKFIERHFDLSGGSYPCHTVRSSEAFVAMASAGVAYCLIPELQIKAELASGLLIKLTDIELTQPLYWHRWLLLKGVYKQVSTQIITHAQSALL